MLLFNKNFTDSFFVRIMSSRLTCFAISIVSVLLYLFFFNVVYEQNDDIWLRSIANGYFTGKVDFHLVYENNTIGYLLKALYNNFQNVEWYALFMISALLIAFFSNLYCILKYEDGMNIFILTLFNILLVYFLSRLQFSYASGFLAISAGISQYYGDRNKSTKLLIFSVFLMLLSSAIRFEMFLFTYFIFFAVFVFNFKKFWDYKIIYAGIILVLLLKLFHNYQYSGEKKWADYYDYNKARQSIVANSNIDYENRRNNEKLDISEQDITLLKQFIFTEKFDTKTMSEFSKENNKQMSISEIFKFCFTYTGAYFIAVTIFFIVSLILKNYRVTAFILLHFILIVATMRYVNNVQYRVLYPSLFGAVFFLLQPIKYNKRHFLFVINTLTISFFLLAALWDVNKTKTFALRTLNYIRSIETQLPKNKVYLVDTTSNMHVYSRLAFQKPMINTVFFGWITNLPTIREKYPSYNSNPYEMSEYPLLISAENYKKFSKYITNTEVYIIEDYKHIKFIKH